MKNLENIEELEESSEEYRCYCVGKHVPLPIVYYKIQIGTEIICLCPTTWYNMNKLLTAYRVYGTVPPGSVRKHYSKYVQELVLELWKDYHG